MTIMRYLLVLSCLLFLAACSPKEEEQAPDYEHMVMEDPSNDEWSTGDRKSIAADLPDPQELIILETPQQGSEILR